MTGRAEEFTTILNELTGGRSTSEMAGVPRLL